jgi:uncharacterized caspase-like protein
MNFGPVYTLLKGNESSRQFPDLLRFALTAMAQRDLRLESSAQRLALIVGNEAYPKWPLRNPVNDARAMDQALKATGFVTEVVLNASLPNLERAIDRFIGRIRNGDVVLFFYAGHGIQVNNENYLIPVDFDAKDEADAKYVSYSASRLQDRIDAAGARLTMIILDACRNNPFRATRAAGGGLATMTSGKGTPSHSQPRQERQLTITPMARMGFSPRIW